MRFTKIRIKYEIAKRTHILGDIGLQLDRKTFQKNLK